ncbi:winged helix-turn-helix domain-containing protein [Streptomyces sp. NPDC058284]|uniref:helix-turn-helix domain-containing protein n=1 Tax=unclassified Streptomyces TaxID=2593676 RepID=UPI0036690C84
MHIAAVVRHHDSTTRGPRAGKHSSQFESSTPGLKLAAASGRHPVFGDPGPLARASLAHPDVALLADLLPYNGDTYTPDLLTPQPGADAHRRDLLDEQIAQIDFWRDALSEGWPELRAFIDQDIAHRATAIATHGIGRALGALHPDMEWAGDALTLAKSWDGEMDAAGRNLVLAPGVLNRRATSSSRSTPPDSSSSNYPTRRIGAGRGRRSGRIAQVVGNARAALPADLETPRSTTELATRTGYTLGTVSYHLSALHRARLVTKVRDGRHVLYQRTAHAAGLLEEARG